MYAMHVFVNKKTERIPKCLFHLYRLRKVLTKLQFNMKMFCHISMYSDLRSFILKKLIQSFTVTVQCDAL